MHRKCWPFDRLSQETNLCTAENFTLRFAFFILRQSLKIENSCFLFKQVNERGEFNTTQCIRLKRSVERIRNMLAKAAS